MCLCVGTRVTVKREDGSNIEGVAAVALHGFRPDLVVDAAGTIGLFALPTQPAVQATFDKMRLHLNDGGRVEAKVRVGPDTWMRLGYLQNRAGEDEGLDAQNADGEDLSWVEPVGPREGAAFQWGSLSEANKALVLMAAGQMLGF